MFSVRGVLLYKYKVILLDLDGTISDPKIGITKSVQYALSKMNIYESDIEKLNYFIGPPLQDSFAEYYNLNEAQTQKAVDFYRERFKEKGMFENKLYEKIPTLLKSLCEHEVKLVIATSKPTVFAKQIIQYFNITHYFDCIVGSNLDGTRTSKTEILQYILNKYHYYKPDEFIMIGDRKHDIIGATNTGIDSIAVTYGYGSYEELCLCKPTYLVHDIDQINNILIGA